MHFALWITTLEKLRLVVFQCILNRIAEGHLLLVRRLQFSGEDAQKTLFQGGAVGTPMAQLPLKTMRGYPPRAGVQVNYETSAIKPRPII